MSIVPPTIVPLDLTGYPSAYRDYPSVQPFSQRSALTYQQKLEAIAAWIPQVLVPYLSSTFGSLDNALTDDINTLSTTVQTALDTQAATINTALTTQQQTVADNLASTLSEIVSGESAALNDAAVSAALQVANSQALAFLDTRYDGRYAPKPTAFGYYLLQGTGIDLTGATVSTTAVQAFFDALTDGASVVVPSNAVINLDNTVTLNHKVHLSGSGELRWTAGIANAPLLHVTKDGSNFNGLYLTNPNHLAGQTGNRTSGIYITANRVRVSQCRIVGQQQAIFVDANGEWHDFTIIGNLIEDVPGSGDGQTSNSGNGEDRGDGIYVMGATATIVGNRVDALVNTDARIGIGLENLSTYEGTAYVHGDSHCVISGNIVTGKFRRGIADEGVTFSTITGNTVADSTWYGISIVNTAHHSIVEGNTIEMSRTSADNQGSAWSPVRSGIMVYDNTSNIKVKGNTIAVTGSGGGSAGIALQVGSRGNSVDAQIEGNQIDGGASNLLTNGIIITNGATRPHIRNNIIKGFSGTGISLSNSTDIEVTGNHIIGPNGGTGIVTPGGPAYADARIDRNTIESVSNAIQGYFRTGIFSVSGNQIKNATTGIDLYGWAATIVVMLSNNNFYAVTTHTTNLPSGTNTTVTNVGNN